MSPLEPREIAFLERVGVGRYYLTVALLGALLGALSLLGIALWSGYIVF